MPDVCCDHISTTSDVRFALGFVVLPTRPRERGYPQYGPDLLGTYIDVMYEGLTDESGRMPTPLTPVPPSLGFTIDSVSMQAVEASILERTSSAISEGLTH